jgi:hypothetical protein
MQRNGQENLIKKRGEKTTVRKGAGVGVGQFWCVRFLGVS